MGNTFSRRRNRQEWTPGKVKRGSKERSDSNGTSHIRVSDNLLIASRLFRHADCCLSPDKSALQLARNSCATRSQDLDLKTGFRDARTKCQICESNDTCDSPSHLVTDRLF